MAFIHPARDRRMRDNATGEPRPRGPRCPVDIARTAYVLPIFNCNGKVVGWLKEPFIVAANVCVAFLAGEAVYAMKGTYLGRFRAGLFRDRDGGAVAFVDGASGISVSASWAASDDPQILSVAPPPSAVAAAPGELVSWGLSWEEFVGA